MLLGPCARLLLLLSVGSSCRNLLPSWLLLDLRLYNRGLNLTPCHGADVVLHEDRGLEHLSRWWCLSLRGLLVLDKDAIVALLVACRKRKDEYRVYKMTACVNF